MVAASLCFHLLGQRWLAICLGVTLLHVITLGPLSDSPGSSFGSDWLFGAAFTAVPLVVGLVALVVAYRRGN
jgi:hypothetical protein